MLKVAHASPSAGFARWAHAWLTERAVTWGGHMRQRQRRIRAYSYAALAVAIFVTRHVAIGDVDIEVANYKIKKLDEISAVIGLDKKTLQIPKTAAICVNWPLLAQVKIGVPRGAVERDMVEIKDSDDWLGAKAMENFWPIIERLAKVLMERGRVTEAEALALIASTSEDADRVERSSAWDILREDEVNAGFDVILPDEEPWFSSADWRQISVVSRTLTEVRIVAIYAKHPGQGAFRRMIADIIACGLCPVVVCPISLQMRVILDHWGWQHDTDADQWRPPIVNRKIEPWGVNVREH